MEASETGTPDTWLNARGIYRQYLFGESDPLPQPTIDTMPLTTLAFSTKLPKRPNSYERLDWERIPPAVAAILNYHDQQAHSPEGYAIFGSIHHPDLPDSHIAAITSRVIWIWERACWHQGRELPFADLPRGKIQLKYFNRPDVQLVVETASGVYEALQAGYLHANLAGDTQKYALARLIATRGPAYATAWIRGDTIRDYCEHKHLNTAHWLRVVSWEERLKLAMSDPDNLIPKAAEMVRGRLARRFYVGLGKVAISSVALEIAGDYQPQPTLPQKPSNSRVTMFNQWRRMRKHYRHMLFNETYAGTETHSSSSASMAEIALHTYMGGPPVTTEANMLRSRSTLPAAIAEILIYHNDLAYGSKDGLALFGFKQPEDLDTVINSVIQIIWQWERACLRAMRPSPFLQVPTSNITLGDFKRQDVRLVIETAAAVCEVLHAGYPMGEDIDSSSRSKFVALVAQRGPAYAAAWMRGDIIRGYCERNGHNAERWLALLTPGLRARIALDNLQKPLKKLFMIIDHFDHTLTPQRIQEVTGWLPGKVATVFPESILVGLAFQNDPLHKIREIVKNVDEILTTENMTQKLKLPPDQINSLFTPHRRYELARENKDPILPARRIARLFFTLRDDFGIHHNLAANAAFIFRATSIDRAIQVLAERSKRPRGVSIKMWDTVVMYFPKPGDKRRIGHILSYRQWWNTHFPSSLDAPISDGGRMTRHEQIAGQSTLDLADIVGADVPGEVLQQLAEKAKVTIQELNSLLSHFAAGKEISELGPLKAVLEKLRRIATKELPPETD